MQPSTDRYAHTMDVADSILDLVGNTPLVRLGGSSGPRSCTCDLVAKVEIVQPRRQREGPSRDRDDRRGGARRPLQPGGTIVEPTSGNTGVGLAIVAAQRGYRCIFVMTDKMSDEKVALLRAYGAEVVVCPTAVPPEDPDSYYSTADRLVRETPGAFRPDQYSNPREPAGARAPDRPRDLAPDRRAASPTSSPASAPAGRSPASPGTSRRRTRRSRSSAPTRGSVYSGGTGRPYLVEGVGEDFWPTTFDPSVVDRVIKVSDAESFLAGASGHARGRALDRRLVRHRGPRRARGRAGRSGPTPSSSCCFPTPAAATCRRSSTTTGWSRWASCAPTARSRATSSPRRARDRPGRSCSITPDEPARDAVATHA